MHPGAEVQKGGFQASGRLTVRPNASYLQVYIFVLDTHVFWLHDSWQQQQGRSCYSQQRVSLSRLHKDAVVVSNVAVQLAILDAVFLCHLSPADAQVMSMHEDAAQCPRQAR
jgi:hypothetical protein